MVFDFHPIQKFSSSFGVRLSARLIVTAAIGLSSSVGALKVKEISHFIRQPTVSHRFAGGDINSIGRTCSLCQRFKNWNEFSLKPKGLNGKDSKCRSCIVQTRKEKRAKARLARKRSTTISEPKFNSLIIGNLEKDTVTEFSQTFAHGICDLLEKGILV